MSTVATSVLNDYWRVLEPLLSMQGVDDICIDRFDYIYIKRGHVIEKTDIAFVSENQLRAALNTLNIASNTKQFDRDNPVFDAQLPGGHRLSASFSPPSKFIQATIRVKNPLRLSLDQMEGRSFSPVMNRFLRWAITNRMNMVLSGETNSGKTTLLRALAELCFTERVFVIEDTAELLLPFPFGIFHECAARGEGAVRMAQSLAHALRSSPQRLFVGEIRFTDALTTFLDGLEAGFRGAITSFHASSATKTFERLEAKFLEGSGLNSLESARHLVRRSIDLVIYCELGSDGHRRVAEIATAHKDQLLVLCKYDAGEGDWLFDPDAFKTCFPAFEIG